MADFMVQHPRVAALLRALKMAGARGPVDERGQVAQEGSEEASKLVPSTLMPRDAVMRKRRQMEEIDRMGRDQ